MKKQASERKTVIIGLGLLAIFYLAVCAFTHDELGRMMDSSVATQIAQE